MWNQKYDQESFLYGTEPNQFFKDQIAVLKPGRLLLPAEGEGRNAVFAAKLGWDVWAFDNSSKGREKALDLANESKVSIRYDLESVEGFHPGEDRFDVVGLFYSHFPSSLRHHFFSKLPEWLNPGGYILLEAFRKDQIIRSSGGPKKLEMLYSLDEIRRDFIQLDVELLSAETIELDEGVGHQGLADVVRFIGQI